MKGQELQSLLKTRPHLKQDEKQGQQPRTPGYFAVSRASYLSAELIPPHIKAALTQLAFPTHSDVRRTGARSFRMVSTSEYFGFLMRLFRGPVLSRVKESGKWLSLILPPLIKTSLKSPHSPVFDFYRMITKQYSETVRQVIESIIGLSKKECTNKPDQKNCQNYNKVQISIHPFSLNFTP